MERRIVTMLFCDLVGYTTLCETNDPEVVDRFLHEYYTATRDVIERFGGGVEKFIGDAVLGLFGAPKAHEDDAERAVRAGLRLVERIGELSGTARWRPALRVGINTGEAVVKLTVDPSSGEGLLVGDAVNTAARLQAIAPPMCVVVGEETHALTAHVIDYEPRPSTRLKGKAHRVPSWIALRPIARYGVDLRRDFSAPLIGREAELAILTGLFDAAVETSSCRFVLITGDAGQGKTRLVAELARSLDKRPGLMCLWRQGRCPPYSQESAYHPLAEIARAHAGILESDPPGTVAEKLERVLRDGPDTQWLMQSLRPLLGLEEAASSREERHLGWRRFLETVATTRPVVLVFEDLHWAGEGMIDFLRGAMRDLAAVPLLVICTARPELADAHPALIDDFALSPSSMARSLRLELNALSTAEAERLVKNLCRSTPSPEVHLAIARGSAGNALYAEELVRWFEETPGHENPLAVAGQQAPRSLEALIAARLDALPPEAAGLLGDAAVMGEVFWAGALSATIGREPADVLRTLNFLSERELVRPGESSLEGESEFAFWHAVTQDVAYRRLTRAARAAKHAAVGDWLQSRGFAEGSRPQLLAHHYATALELAEEALEVELAARVVTPAIEALAAAGRQALAVDVDTAERDFSRAVRHVGRDDARRPALVADWAEALSQKGELHRAAGLYDEAIATMKKTGDRKATAVCLARLSRVLYMLGDSRWDDVSAEALSAVSSEEASPDKVRVLAHGVWRHSIRYEASAAIASVDQVIGLSRQLGLPMPIQALGWRGMARCDTGDRGGLDDMRNALHQGIQRGLGAVSTSIFYNLADEVHAFDGPRAAIEVIEEGLALAGRRGDFTAVLFLKAILVQELSACGEWDQALDLAAEVLPGLESTGQCGDLYPMVLKVAYLRSMRGEPCDVAGLQDVCRDERLLDPGERMECWSLMGAVATAAGRNDVAREWLVAAEKVRSALPCRLQTGMAMPVAVEAARQIGDLALARRLAEGEGSRALDRCVAAAVAGYVREADGDLVGAAEAYDEAATSWRAFGAPYHEAKVHLAGGRCLQSLGEHTHALACLKRAVQLLSQVAAGPDLQEARKQLRSVEGSADGR